METTDTNLLTWDTFVGEISGLAAYVESGREWGERQVMVQVGSSRFRFSLVDGGAVIDLPDLDAAGALLGRIDTRIGGDALDAIQEWLRERDLRLVILLDGVEVGRLGSGAPAGSIARLQKLRLLQTRNRDPGVTTVRDQKSILPQFVAGAATAGVAGLLWWHFSSD